MIEEKGRMIFTTSKVDDKSTNNNYTSKCNTTKPDNSPKNKQIKRKVQRICKFDTNAEIEGFCVEPGNIMGSITDTRYHSLYFFITTPKPYYDGYIEIHAKCNEVRQFGVKALKLDNLNKLEIIKNVESGYDDDSYITLNVEVTKDEYYNLVFIKRKVQKIAISDSTKNINGFNVDPKTILGVITNENGKELTFCINHPFYMDGYQKVFAEPNDIIEYGVENFKVLYESEKEIFINRLKLWEGITPVNLIMDVEEWCSLLSKRQLETASHNYLNILVSLDDRNEQNKCEIKKILSYLNAIDNELASRNILEE